MSSDIKISEMTASAARPVDASHPWVGGSPTDNYRGNLLDITGVYYNFTAGDRAVAGVPTAGWTAAGGVYFVVNGGTIYPYTLRAGTDVQSVPHVIRPSDYAAGTNEFVYDLLNFYTDGLTIGDTTLTDAVGGPTLAANGSGDRSISLTPNANGSVKVLGIGSLILDNGVNQSTLTAAGAYGLTTALTITPASGSNVNLILASTGRLDVINSAGSTIRASVAGSNTTSAVELYYDATTYGKLSYLPAGGANDGVVLNDARADAQSKIMFQLQSSEVARFVAGNLLLGTTTNIAGTGNLVAAGGTVSAGAAATDLTLNGGSSGASLVLGQGANGGVTITPKGSGTSSFGGKIQATATTATGYNTLLESSGITTGRGAIRIVSTGADLVVGTESSVGGTTITGSTAYSSYIGSFTTAPLHLAANGAAAVTILNGGNVGIGTTAPDYPLQVRRAGGAGSVGITINDVTGVGLRSTQYYAIGDSTDVTTGHAFYTRNGTATDNFVLGITSGGNVGVGTTNPLYLLDAVKSSAGNSVDFRIANSEATNALSGARSIVQTSGPSAGDPRFVLSIAGTQEYYIGIDNSDADKFMIGGGSDVGTTPYLTISTGNVLVGTTTDSSNGKLQLATHTTSAGGIGFGTDLSLYRAAASTFVFDDASGNPSIRLASSGTQKTLLGTNGTDTFLDSNGGITFRTNGLGGTTALTLDSSQNATFAGNVNLPSSGVYNIISSGVDGSPQVVFKSIYSGNYNETNAILAGVSADGVSSGWRFEASLGGGSATRYPVLNALRDLFQVYTSNTLALAIDASQNATLYGDLTVSGGNVGVGGAATAGTALYVASTGLSGTDQVGVQANQTFSSAATSQGLSIWSRVRSAAASYTMANGAGLYVEVPEVGSGSAITTLKGISIANQGASGITHAYGLDIASQSGAATTNVAIRAAGKIMFTSLPTSSAGLSSGELWNDSGTVKIV